jgi:hypothetical protein
MCDAAGYAFDLETPERLPVGPGTVISDDIAFRVTE